MNKVNVNKSKLYSTTEIAKLLGISSVSVFKWIKRGKIMAFKIGRAYIVKGEDLAELINPSPVLTARKKEIIQGIVKKVIDEYGEALRKLGKE